MTDSLIVYIRYSNWKNEVAWRRIIPLSIAFTSNQWHPDQQWLMLAHDMDKKEMRAFALKDVIEWRTTPPEPEPEATRPKIVVFDRSDSATSSVRLDMDIHDEGGA